MGESIKLDYSHYLPHLRGTKKVKFLFVWRLFIFQCSPRKQPASSSSQIFSKGWCSVRYHQPNTMNSPITELLPDGKVCLSFKQDSQQPLSPQNHYVPAVPLGNTSLLSNNYQFLCFWLFRHMLNSLDIFSTIFLRQNICQCSLEMLAK